MSLTRLAKLERSFAVLLARLLRARFGQAGMIEDLGQLDLVLRRMESSIEGRALDPSAQSLLERACLLDDHVAVLRVAWQQMMVRDEPDGVFVHQYQSPELDRFPGLAAFVKLRVRFEDAEELFFVGHAFAQDHPATRRTRHVLGALEIQRPFGQRDAHAGVAARTVQRVAQITCPTDDPAAPLQ